MSAVSGSAFTIFIEAGLHAGTVQRLSPGIYTLGSELEADIVLSDPAIKAVHLIVELGPKGLRLEPLQGAIAIQGESADLEPGGERYLSFPSSFDIGQTRIRITAPKDMVQSKRRMRTAMVAAGVAALAVIGLQVVGPFSVFGDARAPGLEPASPTFASLGSTPPEESAGEGMTAAMNPDRAVSSDPPDAAAPRFSEGDDIALTVPAVTLDQAAAALRDRLRAEELSDIRVKVAGDRLMVGGAAPAERMDDWQNVRIWFDGAFGQDLLMVATVEAAEKAEPPKLAIEAVWSGEDPYLIAGGQRFFVGNHVGDGWMIERIGTDEITFKRGDTSFSLSL